MYCLSDVYGLEEVCTQVNGLRISGIRVSAVYTIHMYGQILGEVGSMEKASV